MQRKKKRLRPYFDVGYKVQLRPEEMMTGKYLEGLYGTIMRIEQRPDPNFLGIETPEDWEHFLRIRSVYFWVKLEDFPELDNHYKQHEVIFRYRELQPLPPRMSEQRLAQYCKECFFKEQDKHRSEAYLGVMRYLNGEWPGYPLSLSLRCVLPKGYYVDLINRFISGAAKIGKLAQETRESSTASELAEIYEVHAQVCDEICLRLIPEQRSFATLNSFRPISAHS